MQTPRGYEQCRAATLMQNPEAHCSWCKPLEDMHSAELLP